MNPKKLLIAVLCGSVLALSFIFRAAAQVPGSAEDPLVTRSYVDRLIADLVGISAGANLTPAQLEQIVDEVINRLELREQGPRGVFQHNTEGRYTPVHLRSGQILVGDEGTEIILRSGQAVGHTSGIDGLANITTGANVRHGDAIGNNNMLIIPRGDGRGVRATTEVWLLVKGSFNIIS